MIAHHGSHILVGANKKVDVEYFRPILVQLPLCDLFLDYLSLVDDSGDDDVDDVYDAINQINSK